MATAGEGEDGGLRVSPFVTDTTTSADGPDRLDADVVVPPENSVTQLLPMVRRDDSAEVPGVRAVARRVPSALPALGRADGVSDTPHSARTTADRRRRAVAEEKARTAPTSGSSASAAPVFRAPLPRAPVSGPPLQGAHPEPAEPAAPNEVPAAAEPPVESAAVESPVSVEPSAPAEHAAAKAPAAIELQIEPISMAAPALGPDPWAEPAEPVAPAVPKEAVPKEAAPKAAVPKEAVPTAAVPDEAVPKEAVSTEVVLNEAVLDEAVPTELVPSAGPEEPAPSAVPELAVAAVFALRTPYEPGLPAERDPVALVGHARLHGMPVSHGGEVTALPFMGQPPAPADDDVVEAEILDEPLPPRFGGGRTSVNAAAAEVVSALTEVAFREAQTDEWIMGRPEPLPEPTSGALDLVRPGPSTLDADSWEGGSLPVAEQDSYQGRRRATSSLRLWLVIGAVVAALSAAIAIPWILTSTSPQPVVARTPDANVPADDFGDNSSTSSAGSASSAGASGFPVVGASPLVTSTPSAASPSASSSAPFSLVVEAEQGGTVSAWGSPAGPVTSNGVTVIDKIGDWPGTSQDGWLEFTNISVPTTGPYSVTVYYLYTTQNPDPSTRRLWFRVNDGPNQTNEPTFSFKSTVTARKLYQSVTFQAGTPNKIRFLYDWNQAPAIDRIEIAKA